MTAPILGAIAPAAVSGALSGALSGAKIVLANPAASVGVVSAATRGSSARFIRPVHPARHVVLEQGY